MSCENPQSLHSPSRLSIPTPEIRNCLEQVGGGGRSDPLCFQVRVQANGLSFRTNSGLRVSRDAVTFCSRLYSSKRAATATSRPVLLRASGCRAFWGVDMGGCSSGLRTGKIQLELAILLTLKLERWGLSTLSVNLSRT